MSVRSQYAERTQLIHMLIVTVDARRLHDASFTVSCSKVTMCTAAKHGAI
eukprot:SAG11_NODE_4252_length_1985_cov_1.644751_1_plen_49_part_10